MAKTPSQQNKTQGAILNNPNINILNQHYLNALAHLYSVSPELADRALKITESQQAKQEQITDKLLAMEKKEQEMRGKELSYSNLWYGVGTISFIVAFLATLFVGVYLTHLGQDTAGIFSFLIAGLIIIPKTIKSIKSKQG